MKRRALIAIGAVVLVIGALLALSLRDSWAEFWAVDACLDAGGVWKHDHCVSAPP